MQIYRAAEYNGASEPWNEETVWSLTVDLDWQLFLIGVARYPDYSGVVLSFHFWPLTLNYYRRK